MTDETITIELDTVWKARNASEGRWVNRAKCGDLEEVGDHAVVIALAKRLALHYPPIQAVSVVREGVECFQRAPLLKWACSRPGRLAHPKEQPAQLRRAAQ